VKQAYSTSATFNWVTSSADVGTGNYVNVKVKSQGTTTPIAQKTTATSYFVR